MNNTSKSAFVPIVTAFLFMMAFILSPFGTSTSFAAECDTDFYSSNDVIFYDPCLTVSTDSCSTSTTGSVFTNTDYAGNTIFSTAQLTAIESNKSFYESSAKAQNIPWQLLAAMHGREAGFKKYGPGNGYGPYQITPSSYPISDAYTDAQFQDATDKAAVFIKAKIGSKAVSDVSTIKYALFAYNGMANAYIKQGENLGFSSADAANGEGSPYVMNRFDEKRDPTVAPTKTNGTWGQIKTDGGGIAYPANTDYGAFVYFSTLTNGSLCGGSPSASNGDATAVQAAFTAYMNSHSNVYGTYTLGYSGCTTLSSWYVGEYTKLTYGKGNGEAVVGRLVNANSDKGLVVSDKPIAPSVFSVAGGVSAWGASGRPEGHVGIVVSVDELNKTATVVHTGSSKANEKDKAWVSTFKYPTAGVTFTYIGDNLK
ncbi:MAG: hypothetical protein ACOH18_04330 [Candidatus Saccharimonadaceae bacterium]